MSGRTILMVYPRHSGGCPLITNTNNKFSLHDKVQPPSDFVAILFAFFLHFLLVGGRLTWMVPRNIKTSYYSSWCYEIEIPGNAATKGLHVVVKWILLFIGKLTQPGGSDSSLSPSLLSSVRIPCTLLIIHVNRTLPNTHNHSRTILHSGQWKGKVRLRVELDGGRKGVNLETILRRGLNNHVVDRIKIRGQVDDLL